MTISATFRFVLVREMPKEVTTLTNAIYIPVPPKTLQIAWTTGKVSLTNAEQNAWVKNTIRDISATKR
jgi:hypothetical protein